MHDITFRAYQPAVDEAAVFALWQETLGDSWPISLATFHRSTVGDPSYKAADHEVAESGGVVTGFIATQRSPMRPLGEIMVVLVRPAYQRQGIGRQLVARAVERLRGEGVERFQLGGGGSEYFWPGVPENLPGALAFFEATGWSFSEESIDMALAMANYETPASVMQRAAAIGATFGHPNHEEIPDVIAFERKHFPSWALYFETPLRNGHLNQVLLAKDAQGAIAGSILLGRDNKWQMLLPAPIGAIGAVGVAEEARGQGIGLAMVARATELLREQGCNSGWLGWTYLHDWYSKLGYSLWRGYRMSWLIPSGEKRG